MDAGELALYDLGENISKFVFFLLSNTCKRKKEIKNKHVCGLLVWSCQ